MKADFEPPIWLDVENGGGGSNCSRFSAQIWFNKTRPLLVLVGLAVGCMSACLSVCLSGNSLYCVATYVGKGNGNNMDDDDDDAVALLKFVSANI